MMAEKAYEQLANGAEEDKDFYRAKIQTAEFYFARILPRTKTHYATMMSGSKTLMQIEEEHFAFV
jgi:3-(methylsulfanyl)propanoyl-CoA dehydrogenase